MSPQYDLRDVSRVQGDDLYALLGKIDPTGTALQMKDGTSIPLVAEHVPPLWRGLEANVYCRGTEPRRCEQPWRAMSR